MLLVPLHCCACSHRPASSTPVWTATPCCNPSATAHPSPAPQAGYEVTLIGYRGAALVEELQAPAADGRLTLAYLPDL